MLCPGQGRSAPAGQRRCCALGGCCREFASPATVAHIRRVLRTILTQAVTDGLRTQNIAALVKLPPVRRPRRRAWTSEEARRFLESARHDRDPLYAAYVLVLVLGLRKGELLGLGWDSVDLPAGQLAVDWQLQRVGTRLIRRGKKTEESDATLPMPGICMPRRFTILV